MIQEIPKEFWHATKLHTVAVLLSSLFSKKVKSSSITQRRDRDLFKLLSQSKTYTMHSNIGGIHTNGPTLSNTTTFYILLYYYFYYYIFSPSGHSSSAFSFSLSSQKTQKIVSQNFSNQFSQANIQIRAGVLRRGRQDGSGVLSCVPKDLRKSFIFERDCRVELLNIYTILKNYEKILTLRLIQAKL